MNVILSKDVVPATDPMLPNLSMGTGGGFMTGVRSHKEMGMARHFLPRGIRNGENHEVF
jgi:hypothetical protein